MSKSKFKLNRKGVRELLKSKDMQSVIDQHAANILSRLGDGYEKSSSLSKTRAHGMVWAESSKARRDNLKNNTILKALK